MIKNCNLCGSEELTIIKYQIVTHEWGFYIIECPNCKLISRLEMPKDVEKMYDKDYYSGTSKYSYIDEREDKFLRDIENKRRLDNLGTFFTDERDLTLLDVGCSFGSLVEQALIDGIDAEGVDISNYVKYQSKSNRLRQGDVCDHINGKYSIITMVEVIEHLANPSKALNNCYNALENGGVILIQTTNMDSLVRKFEGEKSRYFMPGHLHYFSLKTLTAMLKKHHFKVEKVYFGHETGLIPALIRKYITNLGRFNWPDWLVALYTLIVHSLSKIHVGNLAVHNGMVIIARK